MPPAGIGATWATWATWATAVLAPQARDFSVH